jgi:hypothetical protein
LQLWWHILVLPLSLYFLRLYRAGSSSPPVSGLNTLSTHA